jgi:hypothetical protein
MKQEQPWKRNQRDEARSAMEEKPVRDRQEFGFSQILPGNTEREATSISISNVGEKQSNGSETHQRKASLELCIRRRRCRESQRNREKGLTCALSP